MRRPLTIVTILTCVILLEAAVLADPPDGMVRTGVVSRARAAQLTTQAITAARAGDCSTAVRLGSEVRDLDPAYYELAAAREPALSACFAVRTPPGPPSAEAERRSVVVGVGLAVGQYGVAQGELRLGWMFHPQLSVFGAVAGAVVLSDEGGYHLLELGARAEMERLFVELRVGRMGVPSGCEFDDPCVTRHYFVWSAGLGLELVHSPHAGLELRGDLLGTTKDTLFLAGLGLSFYL